MKTYKVGDVVRVQVNKTEQQLMIVRRRLGSKLDMQPVWFDLKGALRYTVGFFITTPDAVVEFVAHP